MRRLLSLALLGLLPALLMAQEHPHAAPHWSYGGDTGPGHWGDLESDYSACKSGTRQSPIDIHKAEPAHLPALHFAYQAVPLTIVNNGHTIQVNYAPGSFVRIEGHQYQLVQFHFHHPSEEKVDGHAYDMVAHLVHKDAEGHLAVVAVLLTKGQANSLIRTLWEHLPQRVGHEETVPHVRVNAADFLPKHRGYYAFDGSLTTPPCTEGVRWIVLREPRELSPSEIATFDKLYHDNARPTQPSNGRAVKESS
ncbi:MAG TPA: carbonic anhydrase family protein [Gemmatimonadales bacterium]|nr:carbonic anhydrase family protein [Gemmatimonadales bacterium]